MSWGIEFSKRAIDEFRTLDVWLQEETLDELDQLALNLPIVRTARLAANVYDFVREQAGRRLYVFITYRCDTAKQLIRIRSIGQHVKNPM